jgi:hypothetical protein
MTNLKLFQLPLLAVLLSLGACASGNPKPAPVKEPQTACIDPRPQICTMDYTPVCAQLENGELKTYSNACSACADVSVVAHSPAACE